MACTHVLETSRDDHPRLSLARGLAGRPSCPVRSLAGCNRMMSYIQVGSAPEPGLPFHYADCSLSKAATSESKQYTYLSSSHLFHVICP
ncbi:hypothetical protein CONPUDRAFT_138603 [Coniophora puteana RWD-64-598 SS2]|uniref:Uncharacterized protein n=1 Tax=Coniophora puteana (strain RWD-64-598) TaxID=741705 RepID=A0A5M3MHG6_CONPW|nr:uncharacterized protein CONPUDRAFT_138603 [Coniophora puteana RWD-64-598 SS2]EIW78224.1 hypothetical protein CONPUDRAFT_138603 [Coniophora puteana RWD-64-598 SS2]